ncbi:MAG: pyridoxamine 5'-phosphate oxidase family protein [Proteobacteria bacterium]|nr:pyridoxamine 5'-phosphate oxidase family protein [Pseudomonadota bacterium]
MTKMTQQEKEHFLAGVHVGVLAIPNGSRAPLTVPVWYDYKPGGELWFLTGPTSRKGRLLKQGVRISLCAQTETPPYKYVSIEGTIISIADSDKEKYGRPMARRYLGEKLGDQYTDSGDTEASVIVRVRPESWLAVDYGKR